MADDFDLGTELLEEVITEIASIPNQIERELQIKRLAKKWRVKAEAVRSAVNERRKKGVIPKQQNIYIAHPAIDIIEDVLILGFRETVVNSENEPIDRNFYLIEKAGEFRIIEEKIIKHIGGDIVLDERERILLDVNKKWAKEKIEAFITKPEAPKGLYNKIKEVMKGYIEFEKDAIYGILSAWIIATYFLPVFHAVPYLFVYGKKQSGKSRLLEFLERVCFNAMKLRGVSVAAITDSIDAVRGAFLLDQAESLSEPKNVEIRSALTDSYTQGGGKRRIVDTSNNKRRVREFEMFGFKAFASIKEIDSDLRDRCIYIPMLRAAGEYAYPDDNLAIWADLRDQLYRLLLTRWKAVKEIYQSSGEKAKHRIRELWRPIETVLTFEGVPNEEKEKIYSFFLESMQETQAQLNDHELEIFSILIDITSKNEGEIVELTAGDIAERMRTWPRPNMTEKGLQTWVGRELKLLQIPDGYTMQGNKRIYQFSFERVSEIRKRHTTYL